MALAAALDPRQVVDLGAIDRRGRFGGSRVGEVLGHRDDVVAVQTAGLDDVRPMVELGPEELTLIAG